MKVAKIGEREEGLLRRRLKQRNDQNIELTIRQVVLLMAMWFWVGTGVEGDDSEAACQEVEDVIDEVEKSEKHSTV